MSPYMLYPTRGQEGKKILYTSKLRKANWNGNLLRRKYLLKLVTEGRVEGKGRRGRRRNQPLDDVNETKRYWTLKEEALSRTLRGTRLERGYEPVARQTT
jgi:hypothetical protein